MKALLAQLVAGRTLSADQTAEAFTLIMTGQATGAQIGAMLSLVQSRGPTVEEIVGAARVMREKVVPVHAPEGLTLIDTCGTGGDHAGTFNISTAAAIVAAGAGRAHGVAVAKHGNRSVTSQSGSSQVLEALGVKLAVTQETLTRCLDEAGLCFCFAPAHHPAMKHVMPSRMELGFRTIFNILGPLTNPAGARRQVMGVFDPAMTRTLAQVLGELGAERAMVVHGRAGEAGLDELVTTGPTQISLWCDGRVETTTLQPGDVGLAVASVDQLKVDSPQASARVIQQVLDGEPGPARDIICLNAGAALVTAGLSDDLAAGVAIAADAIDTGLALTALQRLAALTQADPSP